MQNHQSCQGSNSASNIQLQNCGNLVRDRNSPESQRTATSHPLTMSSSEISSNGHYPEDVMAQNSLNNDENTEDGMEEDEDMSDEDLEDDSLDDEDDEIDEQPEQNIPQQHHENPETFDESGTEEPPMLTKSSSIPNNGYQTTITTADEILAIKNNMVYLSHQMRQLMNVLKVQTCSCSHCRNCSLHDALPNQNGISNICRNRASIGMSAMENLSNINVKGNEANNVSNAVSSMGKSFITEKLSQMIQSNDASRLKMNGGHIMTDSEFSPAKRGRKSKYLSPAEKKAVVNYARIHGASAAARKFNIPSAVAAYYHRKSKRLGSDFALDTPSMVLPASSQSVPTSADNQSISFKFEHDMDELQQQSFSTSTGNMSETGNEKHRSQTQSNAHDDGMWNSQSQANPAHSGSPGFLRGRGRGRPKLIGDELDAELVEYMVQVKQANPRQHLTASQALHISRNYILDKSPGLLEEHGGHIRLKITWAMKLVSRIAEREREIQLGLPPGSLQNLGRFNAGSGNEGHGFGGESMDGNRAPHTPEIMNIRELKLPPMDQASSGEMPANSGASDAFDLLSELGAAGNSDDLSNNEFFKSLLQGLQKEDGNTHQSNSAALPQLLSAVAALQSANQANSTNNDNAMMAQPAGAF
ncbi:AT hook-containing protein attf-4 [Ditylenchus destructor]|uniref:AT hook-containing protein attf-4 n=1 Tax=Ditylenchus destructor TaxID=166010 RepID=A0AAD4N5A4_9BILA|nr:AT hook-containing protein attf-4 [Ditylenchus destructor]